MNGAQIGVGYGPSPDSSKEDAAHRALVHLGLVDIAATSEWAASGSRSYDRSTASVNEREGFDDRETSPAADPEISRERDGTAPEDEHFPEDGFQSSPDEDSPPQYDSTADELDQGSAARVQMSMERSSVGAYETAGPLYDQPV